MQKFTIQEIRNNEFPNIVEQIYKVVIKKSISSKINYHDIFFDPKYDGRDIIISDENGTLNIYITTKERFNNCLLITAKKNFLQVSKATYRRMGNGTVQEGIIVSFIYSDKEDYDKYAELMLFDSSENQAKVRYLQSFKDLHLTTNDNFLIDPHTLDVVDEDDNKYLCGYFAMTDINHMLSLLKKSHIKGENYINGEKVIYEDEDLSSFGSVDLNPGGKVIVMNNQQ